MTRERKSTSAGRPKRPPGQHFLDVQRTTTWLEAVLQASGLSVADLDVMFWIRPKGATTRSRPHLFEKYLAAAASPSDLVHGGRPGVVQRVEECFPGTARYFRSPAWDLASRSGWAQADLRGQFEALPPAWRSRFVLPEPIGAFWRQEPMEPTALRGLLSGPLGLDELVVVVLHIREAELHQNPARQLGHFANLRVVAANAQDSIVASAARCIERALTPEIEAVAKSLGVLVARA